MPPLCSWSIDLKIGMIEAVESDPAIPTVLCIDVEPDGRSPDVGSPWLGFEGMLGWAQERREWLAALTGRPVAFSWLLRMDAQVEEVTGSRTFLVDRFADALGSLRAAGDGLGIHTHTWRRDRSGRWVADWGDLDRAEADLREGLGLFRRAFGEPARIHRFGDRYVHARLVAALRGEEVLVDMSVEPGARPVRLYRGWRSTTRPIDHARGPFGPYRPDPDDPLQPAAEGSPEGLWMLPLTSIDASDELPRWRRWAREIRYPGRVRHRPVVLWAPGDATAFWARIAKTVAQRPARYLAFAIRSDVLLEPASRRAFEGRLDALASSELAARLWFTDPETAIAALVPGGAMGRHESSPGLQSPRAG